MHGQDSPVVSTSPPVSKSDADAVEIQADGENTYVGDIATADNNVVIRSKGDIIYCDHAIYNRATDIVMATGNVRLFSEGHFYRGNSLMYNMVTKAITSNDFLGSAYPTFIAAQHVTTPGFNHYRLTNASFTTNNREKPSFRYEASVIEYRPNDEVVLKNVVVYVGDVPVLYIPVIVQSLTDKRPAYEFQIGDDGRFGAFMDNRYNWVANGNLRGSTEFDMREKRGYAGGLDLQYFPSLISDMVLKLYYAQDNLYSKPSFANAPSHGNLSSSNVYDGVGSDNRFVGTYQEHLQFSPDFSSTADLNLWSDPWVTRDYFSGQYQAENQPANYVSLNQYDPNFTTGLVIAPQLNPFFETVERLPELDGDVKQQKIFGTDIQYSSQSSMVNFERKFADTADFSDPSAYIYKSFPTTTAYSFYHPNATYSYNTALQNNYSAYRYDTYQEFSYAHQYFNFLSLTPRIGGRYTYYSDNNQDLNETSGNTGLSSDKITNPTSRFAGDVGLSGDFKISRTWLDASDPNLGIDGIRHVIEPFFNAEYAPSPTATPNEIRGFDNRLYSTTLQPLNWTEYNSIDSIDKEAVVRFGVTNSIETKRNGVNYDLVTLTTEADADFDHNFSAATPNSTLSNLFNTLTVNFSQQLQFTSSTSIDINGGSYNQADTSLTYSPDPSLQFSIGDHYLNHSSIFQNGNDASLRMVYRMNEHWQFEALAAFEAVTGRLQDSRLTVYRDLDAWQLALTVASSEYNNVQDESIFFSLTLKAFPEYKLNTPNM